MTIKLLIALLTLSSVNALEFNIIDPCTGNALLKNEVEVTTSTVGEVSLSTFKSRSIQHLASQYGVSQINNSPIGIDSMEVLSDTKMRAHGWCYSIDGVIPELLMNEVHVDLETKNITWFMGYSTYIGDLETGDHQWVGQCEPTHLLEKSPFPEYCQK